MFFESRALFMYFELSGLTLIFSGLNDGGDEVPISRFIGTLKN
jgi:hypothetical protein